MNKTEYQIQRFIEDRRYREAINLRRRHWFVLAVLLAVVGFVAGFLYNPAFDI